MTAQFADQPALAIRPAAQTDGSVATAPAAAPSPVAPQKVAPKFANQRSEQDFQAARAHSSRVSKLKKLLPLTALLLVFGFGASAMVSFVPNVEVEVSGSSLEDGKLVMKEPKMAGFDKNNRAYDVKASRAIQDLKTPGMIVLESIDALVPMDEKNMADVTADNGVYNSDTEKLVLRDNVLIKGARGMDIKLEEANIDMKTGTMQSSKPVFVTSQDTDLSADSVTVEDNGARIVFKNRVRMTIRKPISRGEQSIDETKLKPEGN
jgi:lipopolysaccharide export system protein LptC